MLAGAVALGVTLPVAHQALPHQWLHDAFSGAEGAIGEGHHARIPNAGATGPPRPPQKSFCPKQRAPVIDDGFPSPTYRESRRGRLSVPLRLERAPAEINGAQYTSTTFNGEFPGPLMVICRGDQLRVNLQNALNPDDYSGLHPGDTNLHTHGFHVKPQAPSDDVFIHVDSGQSFQYEYDIPRDHPPGQYWYHPHLHGQTNQQTYGGAAGAIVILGGLDGAREWRDIPVRDLIIQQTTLGDGETVQPGPEGPFQPNGAQFFVNGELNPEIDIRPGELQRWRIYNLTAGAFVDLQLEGQPLRVVSTDGNTRPRITPLPSELIGPASRREILVRGTPEGSYQLVSRPFADFLGGQATGGQALATLNSQGPPVGAASPTVPRGRLPNQQADLRDDRIDSRHEIVYTVDFPNFLINGEKFSGEQDVMEMMRINKTSEWTITNSSKAWHTFHIHINDFQVTERNGVPIKGRQYLDNIPIPPEESITMRYRPTDFTGKFVFHCHVLGHEDNGMMAVAQVLRENRRIP